MWEYKFIESDAVAKPGTFKTKSAEDFEAYFNALGREGWEIICLDFSDMKTVFYGVAKRRLK